MTRVVVAAFGGRAGVVTQPPPWGLVVGMVHRGYGTFGSR